MWKQESHILTIQINNIQTMKNSISYLLVFFLVLPVTLYSQTKSEEMNPKKEISADRLIDLVRNSRFVREPWRFYHPS